MRIAIIGQQDFGKSVLEAFLNRGDDVAAVFCAPEKEGGKPDPLRVLAQEKGLKTFQFPSLKAPEATAAMRELNADIGIMAFVLQFAPQEFVNIPKHGTIQYHPSLLPKYRGPSSINWPISRGEKETGLTIFRPTDGLDEGAVILQKTTAISENDTLGTVYFDRLFPMGVAAMLEAADLVVAGKHKEVVQDESLASYEGWFRANESKINWHNSVDVIHDLIRACDPAPGAWTTLGGKKVQLFGSKKHPVRTFGAVKGKPGEITSVGETMFITAQGGQIEVAKLKHEDGKKVGAADFASAYGVTPSAAGAPGTLLGT
jgi:methionyl-tRNA formyltransferase